METLTQTHEKSKHIFEHNRKYIPGGVMSLPRRVEPELAFERADGAYLWDADGNRYLDYHAAFAPAILGHNDRKVNAAVEEVLKRGLSLCGSGTNELEGRLADLMCTNIEVCEMVQILNTGTEATMAAIRLARGATGPPGTAPARSRRPDQQGADQRTAGSTARTSIQSTCRSVESLAAARRHMLACRQCGHGRVPTSKPGAGRTGSSPRRPPAPRPRPELTTVPLCSLAGR